MKIAISSSLSSLRTLAVSMALALGAGVGGVQADDTEVFFPENASSAEDLVQRPNIMFMLDTSGSMACSSVVSISSGGSNICEFDTDPISRIDRLKSALIQVLDDLPPNVNVGMSRFSGTEGAAILFPVAPIDAALSTVIGNKVRVDALTSSIAGSEAEENLTNNTVQLSTNFSPSVVRLGTYDPTTGTTTVTPGSLNMAINNNFDEAEQWSNGIVETGDTTSGRRCGLANTTATRGILNLVANPTTYTTASNACAANNSGTGATPGKQLIGLRFRNVNLPKNATVTSAKLTFTVSAAAPATVRKVDFRVRGEAADNSAAFTVSNNNVSGRSTTGDIAGSISSSTNPASGTLTLSPELKDIVTSIKDRSGWSQNNAMTFILVDDGSNNSAQRQFHSFFSGGAANAPRLSINYETSSTPPPTANKMLTGLRFENVQIPRGATIQSAYLELRARGAQTNTTLSPQISVNVKAHDVGDSATLLANNADLSSRARTTASQTWTLPTSVSSSDSLLTPDIKNVIQEVTDDAAWCGGNALTLLLDGSANTGLTNNNRFLAYSNTEQVVIDSLSEEIVLDGPILHIELSATDTKLSGATAGCSNGRSTTAIAVGADDARQSVSDGTVNLTETAINLGFNGSVGQINGLRFTNIRVPQGANILSAFIDFTAANADTGAAGFQITAHNTGSSAPLTTTANSLSALAPLTSAINWNTADATLTSWVANTTYPTPDLKTAVQSIIDGSWTEGGSMTFLVRANCPSGNTQCRRRAYSREGKASGAARLRIQYQGSAIALTVRDELKRLALDLPASGGTPSVEALWEAARYMRGEAAFYGRTRGSGQGSSTSNSARQHRISQVKTFTTASGQTNPVRGAGCFDFNPGAVDCTSERWDGTTVYQTPITNACSSNNLIFFTDGTPNSNDGGETKVRAMTGDSSCATTPSGIGQGGNCAVELARYLKNNDQSTATVGGNLTGSQTINTFGVLLGFAANSPQDQWMDQIAAAGGGTNFLGNDAQELVTAFNTIISNILDVNTTFAAPAVTVNTFNRLTNREELYFSLFQPQAQVKWEGNLKRYRLTGTPPRIVDAAGLDAIDPATGFFKDTARSFWTPSGTNDGKNVNQGGMASVLTNNRSMYTYTGANLTPPSSPVNLTAESMHEDNTTITGPMLGLPSTGDTTADAAERAELLRWIRGIDVDDDDGDSVTTDARTSLSDPLHSEPLLVTYKASDSDNDGVANPSEAPDITLYYGDNEGVLHAVNPDNGSEVFSFVPKELFGNFHKIRGNTVSFRQRPYGLDGPITRFHNDLNRDLVPLNLNGTVQSSGGVNESVHLYIGMRRGGRNYYSLDVTDRASPKLRWTIYGGAGQYAELGQSWSRAVVTKIKLNDVVKDVIIFSGGYDPAQDGHSTIQSDNMGRAIYIADAFTGQRLWWASSQTGADLSLSTMTYSTPASPKVIDMNGDSIADRIYMSDAGGQIFRINLNASNTGAASLATGSRIAVLSDANLTAASRTAANARRFFASPDVSLIKDRVAEPFLAIAIGSGFREKPNNQTIQDRFYVLRDPDEQIGENNTLNIVESDLFDATDNVLGQGSAAAKATAQTNLDGSKGFYIKLVDSSNAFKGEKVIADSLTFNNQVIFTSFQPGVAQSTCSSVLGLSRLYFLNIVDGTPVAELTNNTPPDPPKCGGTVICDKEDRVLNLQQQGLPPDPTLLFSEASPNEATLCVATECFDLGLTVETTKTYWLKKSD